MTGNTNSNIEYQEQELWKVLSFNLKDNNFYDVKTSIQEFCKFISKNCNVKFEFLEINENFISFTFLQKYYTAYKKDIE